MRSGRPSTVPATPGNAGSYATPSAPEALPRGGVRGEGRWRWERVPGADETRRERTHRAHEVEEILGAGERPPEHHAHRGVGDDEIPPAEDRVPHERTQRRIEEPPHAVGVVAVDLDE